MPISEYIKQFFSKLEIYEDKENGNSYKNDIYRTIISFLDNKTEENAYKVY